MRVGVLVEGSFYSNFDERNTAGTWTYRTIEDFIAGRPAQFSQRLGTVDTSFSQYQAGFYWSDEFRVHRDLSLGVGVRNELQSRIDDKLNLMPRVGFTWAPFGSQTSAIRGGYGLFYDWYDSEPLRPDAARRRRRPFATSASRARRATTIAPACAQSRPLTAGVTHDAERPDPGQPRPRRCRACTRHRSATTGS